MSFPEGPHRRAKGTSRINDGLVASVAIGNCPATPTRIGR